MDYSAIGKRIRLYRKKKGWTIEKFAERLELSSTHVGLIERGENAPGLETLVRIANTLEVSTDMLLSDSLSIGYMLKSNEIGEMITDLSKEDRDLVLDVLQLIVSRKKKPK